MYVAMQIKATKLTDMSTGAYEGKVPALRDVRYLRVGTECHDHVLTVEGTAAEIISWADQVRNEALKLIGDEP